MRDYAFYIWSAYGAAALAICALVLHYLLDYRAQHRALARLEADGTPPMGDAMSGPAQGSGTPPGAASGKSPSSATPDALAEASGRRPSLLMLLPVIVFVGLAGLFAVRLGSGDPSLLPSALLGRPVPAFDLPPLPGLAKAGRPVPGLSQGDLGGRPKGEVTIVNVWASWCAPCRLEHPLLEQLATQPGTRLVGLNYKDKPDAALRFLQALGNPFAAIGTDASGRAAIEWGVYGVPETFIVAADGTIRHKHVGPLTEENLPAFLAKARAAAAP